MGTASTIFAFFYLNRHLATGRRSDEVRPLDGSKKWKLEAEIFKDFLELIKSDIGALQTSSKRTIAKIVVLAPNRSRILILLIFRVFSTLDFSPDLTNALSIGSVTDFIGRG